MIPFDAGFLRIPTWSKLSSIDFLFVAFDKKLSGGTAVLSSLHSDTPIFSELSHLVILKAELKRNVLLYTIFSLFSYEKCSLQLLGHLEKKLQNISLTEYLKADKKEKNSIGLQYFSKDTWVNWLKFVSYNQT